MDEYGMNTGIDFDALKREFEELPSVDGVPYSVSDIGELYIPFWVGGFCRPGDEKITEEVLANQMRLRLNQYFEDRAGLIYWRERLELDVWPASYIVRFDENGPDEDAGRRCVKDKNWMTVKIYCRLVRARLAISGALRSKVAA